VINDFRIKLVWQVLLLHFFIQYCNVLETVWG
jgi:hypothetical protein